MGGSGGVCLSPAAHNVPLHNLYADSSDPPALSHGPPPLIVKGLPLIQGLWEGRGEDILTASHHHPGPRMEHALPPGAGSTVPQEGHSRHQGCLCTGGLCLRSVCTARSACVSTSAVPDHVHLNAACPPDVAQCQHRCARSHTAQTEELCSFMFPGERKYKHTTSLGTRFYSESAQEFFLLQSHRDHENLSLCTTPAIEEPEIEASWYSSSTHPHFLEIFGFLSAGADFQKGVYVGPGFSVQYRYIL